MLKYSQIFFLATLVGCSTDSTNQSSDRFDWIERINENDSAYVVVYYNQNDTSVIDSIYRYQLRAEIDSFMLATQTIYTHNDLLLEVNDSIKISLKSPRYDYYVLELSEPLDTVIWGPYTVVMPTEGIPQEKRSIVIPNYSSRPIKGMVQDYGIIPLADTIGSIGYQISRNLPFEIANE